MREEARDLFAYKPRDALCVTTNGYIKLNGAGVMGRGVARQAAKMYPGIEYALGISLKVYGNTVQPWWAMYPFNELIIFFPTKQSYDGPADIDLIERSTIQLIALAKTLALRSVVLPRPGCGNGRLDWASDVKPVIDKYLDDRFIVVNA
jgi:hypothetical protein